MVQGLGLILERDAIKGVYMGFGVVDSFVILCWRPPCGC